MRMTNVTRNISFGFTLAFALQFTGFFSDVRAEGLSDGNRMPVLFDAQERFPGGDLSSVPRIRFLMSVDFPPFNFTDQEGRLAGFHVDLVREICAQLKVESKCQVQALPFDELEAALELGEGEAVISGLATTADLRKSFTFSRPYLLMPARLAVNKAAKFTGSGADALSGKKVGVVAGSRHEQMLKAFFPKAVAEGFDGYELSAITNLFPSIEIFEADQNYEYTANVVRVLGALTARSYADGPIAPSGTTLNKVADIFQSGSEHVPFENVLQGMLSISWGGFFLELYRAIEQLYAVPRLAALVEAWPTSLPYRSLADLLESHLAWRPKEDDALAKIIAECDDTIVAPL